MKRAPKKSSKKSSKKLAVKKVKPTPKMTTSSRIKELLGESEVIKKTKLELSEDLEKAELHYNSLQSVLRDTLAELNGIKKWLAVPGDKADVNMLDEEVSIQTRLLNLAGHTFVDNFYTVLKAAGKKNSIEMGFTYGQETVLVTFRAKDGLTPTQHLSAERERYKAALTKIKETISTDNVELGALDAALASAFAEIVEPITIKLMPEPKPEWALAVPEDPAASPPPVDPIAPVPADK